MHPFGRYLSVRSGVIAWSLVLFSAPAPAASLRIMPVGDSITLGYNVPGGYRAPLYQLLTNAGHSVDFLGTQTGFPSPELPDSDHEGYGGYRIDQIDSIVPGTLAAVGSPDIILLLIGSSDFAQGYDMNNATNRLEALIVRMATNQPGAKIIVANLLVRGEPYNSQIQMLFNPFVSEICDRQRALGRQVFFNDLRSAVTMADLADGVHPTPLGYEKLATNWFAAITAAIDTNGGAFAVQAEADAYVRSGTFSSNNFGSATVLGVGVGGDSYESYLRFALTNVFAPILEARLRFRPEAAGGPGLNALAVVADNSWSEATITWDNRPPGSLLVATWSPPNAAPVELNVTAAVQNAAANGGRISFRMFAPEGAPLAVYGSREAPPLYSPRLLLTVSNSLPTISTLSNQIISNDSSVVLPITIGDAETPLEFLGLAAMSSNTNLISNTNITFSGTGSERMLTIVPRSNQLGTATIAVTVNDGLVSVARHFDVTVVGSNSPPTSVLFSTPAGGALFTAPATIPLAVTANDPNGNVVRVDYFLGNAIIGSATSPPFAYSWANVPPGTYRIRAIATDGGGLTATSALRQVSVQLAPLTLIPSNAVWKYYDVNGVDLGTAWRVIDYDDAAWLSGPAKLGFGSGFVTQVNPTRTRVTTYFRRSFFLAEASAITNLTIGLIRDDGAVVFLNGNEVFRSNMPGGTIGNSTLALSAISGADENTWFTNRITNPPLVSGMNTIAVEVHQGSTNSSDLGFNLLLAGQIESAPPSSIALGSQVTSTNLTLSWPTNAGWNLYSTPTLGPNSIWMRVTEVQVLNGQRMLTISPTQAGQFFQLRQP